ncbi:hypothetical protein MNBD_GAMMA09-3852 [hydrothermal vent metagenome]|uniref:Uncharacterized protein n=1 Tax=hydrothermal vent metagenome TaxID=652676 RepID=A0A3B0X073_9ZZZZ
MKRVLPLFLLSIVNCSCAGDLKFFESDGCSGFPDGTHEQHTLWLSCCTEHDRAYWKGGTYEERKKADKALKVCVEKQGEPEIASLMLAGVRVGGTPYLPTAFRWGYGWPYSRFYKALTEEELEEVKAKSVEKPDKPID